MTRQTHPVRDYIDRTFAPEDELLTSVRLAGEALRPGMQISSGEGQLLYMLARMIDAKRIVEIGCFMGYSAIWMARALPQDGQLITLEASPEYAQTARTHFAQTDLPITLLEGDAAASLATLEGPFDLVFIDADKSGYARYLDITLPMLRSGGLLIGDNSLLFGAMTGQAKQSVSNGAIEAMQQFNNRLATSDQVDAVMIPTDEGLTVARKR